MKTERIEEYVDAAGKLRWRAIAVNGRIVADSAEGYDSHASMQKGLWALWRALFWSLVVGGPLPKVVRSVALAGIAGALLAAGAGCTSTKIKSTADGDRELKRVTVLQKSDIRRVKFGDAEMEGYRNDGGAGVIEVALDMMKENQALAVELAVLKAAQSQVQAPTPLPVPVIVAPPTPPTTTQPPAVDPPAPATGDDVDFE